MSSFDFCTLVKKKLIVRKRKGNIIAISIISARFNFKRVHHGYFI